jgi:hypothetical protein
MRENRPLSRELTFMNTTGARQITPHRLWVGHAGDGRDFRQQFDKGIRAIVELAMEEPPIQAPREQIVCRFPLLDGAGNSPEVIDLAITSVAALCKRGIPTLVCCGGGMSRSPAIVAAALSLLENASPEEYLKYVAGFHPMDVSPALWQEIRQSLDQRA